MGKELKQHAAPLRTARNLLIFLEKKKTNKETTTKYKITRNRIQGRFETISVFQTAVP